MRIHRVRGCASRHDRLRFTFGLCACVSHASRGCARAHGNVDASLVSPVPYQNEGLDQTFDTITLGYSTHFSDHRRTGRPFRRIPARAHRTVTRHVAAHLGTTDAPQPRPDPPPGLHLPSHAQQHGYGRGTLHTRATHDPALPDCALGCLQATAGAVTQTCCTIAGRSSAQTTQIRPAQRPPSTRAAPERPREAVQPTSNDVNLDDFSTRAPHRDRARRRAAADMRGRTHVRRRSAANGRIRCQRAGERGPGSRPIAGSAIWRLACQPGWGGPLPEHGVYLPKIKDTTTLDTLSCLLST